MKDNTRNMVSCKFPNWITPTWLFNALNDEFGFDFDPCPEQPKYDGLTCDWGQSNFVNPPYVKKRDNLVQWLRKGVAELRNGKTSVFLLAVHPSTGYFRYLIWRYAAEIRWIHCRLNFLHPDAIYPLRSQNYHGSCLVIFRPHEQQKPDVNCWNKTDAAVAALQRRGLQPMEEAIQNMKQWFDSFDDRPHRKALCKKYWQDKKNGMTRKEMDLINEHTMRMAAKSRESA